MLGKKLIQAASGNAAGGGLGIEDVFSTWLYTGNGSTQTITNGIDLAGEGGLVWTKNRASATFPNHVLNDTERGAGNWLDTSSTAAQATPGNIFSSFNSDGFTILSSDRINENNITYASWTFRKAPGFFDVVTYTGTGSTRTVAHNLGSVPGVIIVKKTSSAASWIVHHRSLGATQVLELDGAGAAVTRSDFNNTLPTASEFTVSNSNNTNNNGDTYVAYLFAHDEQIFGEGGDQSVIKCGSYTGNGSTSGPVIDLGWEPQFVLVKAATVASDWTIFDSMRGIPTGGNDAFLSPNASNAESTTNFIDLTSTGFQPARDAARVNTSGASYIYIAIRRGPMKTPTSAAEVFGVTAASAEPTSTPLNTQSGVLVDSVLHAPRINATTVKTFSSRITGDGKNLRTTNTDAEYDNSATLSGYWKFDSNTNAYIPANGYFNNTSSGTPYSTYSFRRAPGFFDVVAYTGTGSARTVNHNLGVAPELMIVKRRDSVGGSDWRVYSATLGGTYNGVLNSSAAFSTSIGYWNDTDPTSTVFSLGFLSDVNHNGGTFIAYLYATCPGVSKVGSYTGTGTTLDIDCGFTSGARFVLIKRTDSTGDWYVWDSARGIVSGNDPYLLLNSTAAEVTSTDYIDPLSSGFQISSTAPAAINASGGTFVFLAIS